MFSAIFLEVVINWRMFLDLDKQNANFPVFQVALGTLDITTSSIPSYLYAVTFANIFAELRNVLFDRNLLHLKKYIILYVGF